MGLYQLCDVCLLGGEDLVFLGHDRILAKTDFFSALGTDGRIFSTVRN